MSTCIWKKKADKYKLKYLALKKQLGGFVPEPEFMTSRIDPKSNFYLSQNLFSYWISSSHNTYLPHDQNFDKVNICYYNLQSMVYSGGCVEIDTYGIKEEKVIISHMNNGYIFLDDILDVIMETLNNKIKRRIESGPFILNFDNSSPNNSLKTKSDQNIFWKTINEKLLSGEKVEEYKNLVEQYGLNDRDNIPVQRIDNNFDLSNISIKQMSRKILFRWGLNKKCKPETEEVGHELCPPKKEIADKFTQKEEQWIHIDKSKMEFMDKFVPSRNMSQSLSTPLISISIPLISKSTKMNLFSIVNTQRNLMRFYPNMFNISSGNYDNMKYFRDGAQITALNLQKIGNARLLNDAVFIPPTSKFCSPEEILGTGCQHIHDFQPYRLKPLWLLGLVPYPDLYDLKIVVPEDGFTIMYGLNKKKYESQNNEILIPDIDVTVPFFVIEKSKLKNGIEIVWNKNEIKDKKKLTFNLYKLNFKEGSKFNLVNLEDNCQKDKLLNYSETQQFTIEYSWTESKSTSNDDHKNLVKPYNDLIIKTRDSNKKTTIELLNDHILLNEYQDSLFSEISKLKP